jgi:tripartite-type tricarboxylate transporter receptor subunit TctC
MHTPQSAATPTESSGRRRILLTALAAGVLGGTALAATAQEVWKPTRPITLIVPFPPGGGSDVLVRSVAPALSARLGQTVVVDNKTGAAGAIGSDFVYRAAPDGYTLLVASLDAQSMAPHVQKVPFDATKFTLVGGMASMGYALMGRADLPAQTLPELLSLMKRQELTYASGGAGSSLHIFTELFARETGTKMLHVPYKGAGPGVLALLGGQVDLMMVPIAVAPQHRGKLKLYGITPGQRVESMKDVPTLSEQGVNVAGASWMGVVAPPATPSAVVNTVSAALSEIIASPELKPRLLEIGMTPISMSQPEFAKFYADEYRRWGDVVRSANIRAD